MSHTNRSSPAPSGSTPRPDVELTNALPVSSGTTRRPRARNFTDEEDIAIVRAWLITTEDAVSGVEQAKGSYKARIRAAFEAIMPGTDRTEASLYTRLVVLKKEISKFEGIMKTVEAAEKSGTTRADRIREANALFAVGNNKGGRPQPMSCLAAWEFCRNDEQYSRITNANATTSLGSAQQVPSQVNNTGDRPMGRKKAKLAAQAQTMVGLDDDEFQEKLQDFMDDFIMDKPMEGLSGFELEYFKSRKAEVEKRFVAKGKRPRDDDI